MQNKFDYTTQWAALLKIKVTFTVTVVSLYLKKNYRVQGEAHLDYSSFIVNNPDK